MYELFILSQLMDRPMHGYMLHQIIRNIIGPVRDMSWGALYPLIRRLDAEELIIIDDAGDAPEDGRKRKRYRITEAGRQRFYQLMRESGAYDADYHDLFTIKLANFDHIGVEERRMILQHYHTYVRFLHDDVQTHRRRIAVEPEIPESERAYILRALDHRLHLVGADEAWIRAELDDLERPGDDGSVGEGC